MGQGIFIDLFQESHPEHIKHGKGTADYMPGQFVQPSGICVHPRGSAFICVKHFLRDAASKSLPTR
jgi:hypothetical protein